MILVEKKMVRKFTRAVLMLKVMEVQRRGVLGSFILSDLLGEKWSSEYEPFYQLYNKKSIAGQEMGKLLASVCGELNLRGQKENRYGKRDAITRYFFA